MPIKVQGGKEYRLVSERLVDFFDRYEDYSIETEILDGKGAVKATIRDGEGHIRATGHGQASGSKALQKSETNAVGRALAFLDKDLMGQEVASAEEMQDFQADKVEEDMISYMGHVREHFDSIAAIKAYLFEVDTARAADDHEAREIAEFKADEAWQEIGEGFETDRQNRNNPQMILWRAPTRGGIFTTRERQLLKEIGGVSIRKRNEE